jgi:UDP-glucose 4-epimerase
MTILVTGGTGLVGSRLLKRLVAAGIDCRALVRAGKEVPAGVTAIEGDILDPESLPAAVEGMSAIVHLAAVFRTTDEDAIWRVNLEGTRNLIAAVKDHAPATRFIMASTSNVYNPDSAHPGREDDPVKPTLAYPASKVDAENELQKSGLNWSVLRLPFVYGDGDGHLESVPAQLSALNWHPARKMSLIHHRDIATAFQLALTGVMDGRVVNIADDAPTTLYEIAQIVGASYEPSAEPLENPWMLHTDGSLARSLGFRPTMATVHQARAENAL